MASIEVGVATVYGVPSEAEVIDPLLAGLAQNPVRCIDSHKPLVNLFLKNNEAKLANMILGLKHIFI
jgi:hypothetical protein